MKKIMIVGDDKKISELLQSYINKYEYKWGTTQDFEHVLDQFRDVQPDLVLLDINLPDFDGLYWCHQNPLVPSFLYRYVMGKWTKIQGIYGHGIIPSEKYYRKIESQN